MNDNDVIDDILKNAVRCFAVKRGEFYADKNFGSKINTAPRLKSSGAAFYWTSFKIASTT